MNTSPRDPTAGWFAVALSGDVARGAVRPVQRFGRELALLRTETGRVALVDGWCPHLGASLGQSGRVDGEQLVCGFHGFRFDADGRCAAGSRGSDAPRGADLGAPAVVERDGVVWAWHDPAGGDPTWEVPHLPTDGWSATRWDRVRMPGHPRQTTENSVDLAHFAEVHGYEDVEIVEPLRTDGERLDIGYTMARRFPALRSLTVRNTFRVTAHGLGLSIVHVEALDVPYRARLRILASVAGTGEVEVFLGAEARLDVPMPATARRAVGWALAHASIRALRHDVEQDAQHWRHQRHTSRPRLSAGDGPIGRYRAHIRQFEVSA